MGKKSRGGTRREKDSVFVLPGSVEPVKEDPSICLRIFEWSFAMLNDKRAFVNTWTEPRLGKRLNLTANSDEIAAPNQVTNRNDMNHLDLF